MCISVLAVTIPIYADNQDSGEIQTSITVMTDKSSYENSERVTIFGNISNHDSSSQSPLTFVVKSPENNLVILRQLVPKSDGSFEFSFITGGPIMKYNGDYIVAFKFGSISGETKFIYTGGDLDFTPVICASNEQLVNGVCVLKKPEPSVDKEPEPFDTLESNIPEVSSEIIHGKGSSIWDGDDFTINYPTGWLNDQGKRTASGEYRYVISFFNEQDTAQITITRVFYPEMFVTIDFFYDMFDNPEKYNLVLDKDIEENFFSVFIAMEISELLQCEYNYEDDYGCTDFTVNALRLFENEGELPALQIEYSFEEKFIGDNTNYGYSALVTKFYLQDRPIVIYSDSSLNDYEQLRPYFVDAANSFTILAEDKLSEKTKLRLLSDMKSFPNSDIAEMMNDALEQTKGYSIPIIEYGQNSLVNGEPEQLPKPIPEWVRGVFVFWANGDISDAELTSAVAFLIDSNVIKVPLIQELQNQISQLKAENSELRTNLELPQSTPEPISQQEPQISVQTDDSNKNEIRIDSNSPLLPNISIANPRVVDAFGNELDSVSVGQQVQIGIDITNHNNFEQLFNYHITIRGIGYEESISGLLSDSQSFSPALTWIPTEAGIFIADISVFDNMQDKNKLTDSITLQIRVS